MVLLFMVWVVLIMISHIDQIIPALKFVLSDAFTGNAMKGGVIGTVIIEGSKRAAFSNEAGIGMAPMMHGAAKTKEPVREGLVAMLGPAIDTIIVCTLTGLAILVTGTWNMEVATNISDDSKGVLMTMKAFESLPLGGIVLTICVIIFAITTIFGVAYYGEKCLSYLVGVKFGKYFRYWFVALVLLGSVASLTDVVNLVFVAYGLMAVPTMISSLVLAPRVMEAAKVYFKNVNR